MNSAYGFRRLVLVKCRLSKVRGVREGQTTLVFVYSVLAQLNFRPAFMNRHRFDFISADIEIERIARDY